MPGSATTKRTCSGWGSSEWRMSAPATGFARAGKSPRGQRNSSWPCSPGAGSAAGHSACSIGCPPGHYHRRPAGERSVVEVKIGIQSTPRELVVETESGAEEIERSLTSALADGSIFAIRDDKGGRILIPAEKVAYVELAGSETRRIGFGNL